MRCTTLATALSVLAVAAFAPALAAQSKFEGVVSMQMTMEGKTQPVQLSVKGTKARMDMEREGRSMTMLMDYDAGKMQMLMPQMKMYMEHTISDPSAGDKAKSRATITKTGKTDVVAGHKCEIIVVKAESGDEAEVCGATDMGTFTMPKGPMDRRAVPAWAEGMEGFFPLRVKGKDNTLEVTKIDAKSLDDSLFVPPAGYKAMAMPSMGGPPKRQ